MFHLPLEALLINASSRKAAGDEEVPPTRCVSLGTLLDLSEPNLSQLYKCVLWPRWFLELFSPFRSLEFAGEFSTDSNSTVGTS